MNNKTTVTTLNVSVGADNGQSPSVTKHSNSITDNNCVRNLQSTGTPVGENLERESIDEQEKEIDGLYDDRKKLGYFKKFLKKEDYNKVVEMGEENYKRNVRSR